MLILFTIGSCWNRTGGPEALGMGPFPLRAVLLPCLALQEELWALARGGDTFWQRPCPFISPHRGRPSAIRLEQPF